jgi:hypothetical protein
MGRNQMKSSCAILLNRAIVLVAEAGEFESQWRLSRAAAAFTCVQRSIMREGSGAGSFPVQIGSLTSMP